MQVDTRTINGQVIFVDVDEHHIVECEECAGHGETEGAHIQNCDVGEENGCQVCKRNRDCPYCGGDGMIACDGCELCEQLEAV